MAWEEDEGVRGLRVFKQPLSATDRRKRNRRILAALVGVLIFVVVMDGVAVVLALGGLLTGLMMLVAAFYDRRDMTAVELRGDELSFYKRSPNGKFQTALPAKEVEAVVACSRTGITLKHEGTNRLVIVNVPLAELDSTATKLADWLGVSAFRFERRSIFHSIPSVEALAGTEIDPQRARGDAGRVSWDEAGVEK